MDEQEANGQKMEPQKCSHSSKHSDQHNYSKNLYSLIGEQSAFNIMPYRSKFQINSIGSIKSRQSRDSDLLNRLAHKQLSSKSSSKSLNKSMKERVPINQRNILHSSSNNSNSNEKSKQKSSMSDKSIGKHDEQYEKIEAHMMAPKIHNCVCYVAGECLNYNCNCFLSPYPCAPECCPNCLTLKSNLPMKVTNMCSCKNTKCLKLYCECLSKGIYCSIMCRCQLCQNHQHSSSRQQSLFNFTASKGCSCQKSHCQKKYCSCYAQNLKCTNKCGCLECHNMIFQDQFKEKKQKGKQKKNSKRYDPQPMEEEFNEPELEFQAIDFFGSRKK